MAEVAGFRNVMPEFSERIRMRPPPMARTLPSTPPPIQPTVQDAKGKRKSKMPVVAPVPPPQPHVPPPDKYEMDKFFAQSMEIRSQLEKLVKTQAMLDESYKNFLLSHSDDEQAKYEEQIEAILNLANTTSLDIKGKLAAMNADSERIGAIAEKGSGDIRMRTLHHASLIRQFSEAMKIYNKIQKSFANKQRDQIKSTYLIVRPYATMAELDRLFDSTGNVVLTRNDIYKLGERGDLKKHLDELKQRRASVLNIEQGIKTLNQMFIEMQMIVEEQGEMIDRIESSLEHVEDYLEEARVHMEEAREYQKAIRKKKCSIF